MGMGIASGMGAGAGADALQEQIKRLAEMAFAKQKLAEDVRQANMQHQIQQGQLGLGGRRIDEDARQFGVSSGQSQQKIDLDKGEQPLKLRLMGAQAGEIERKPQAEQEAREFTTGRDKTLHGYGLEDSTVQGQQRMREIGAQGANALRVANVRHPDPSAPTGPTQKEQNEVSDALDVIKSIREDTALPSSTGPIQGRGFGALQDLEGFTRVKAHHDNLVNKMQLAQAGQLKGQGAISNMEREMLKNAATALDMKLGDPDYLKELAKVESQFKRMLSPTSRGPVGSGPSTGVPHGGGPKVGDQKKFANGSVGIWDGQGWVKQ